jgi:hypothetical protein
MIEGLSMYERLVSNPEDVLGALAYTAYKQHELEVMSAIVAARGRVPTSEEMEQFILAASAPSMVDMYIQRAQRLMQEFLELTLQGRSSEIENKFRTTSIAVSLQAIRATQLEKRTWKGWLTDLMGNLAVNFLTIILIAAVIYGYRQFDQLTGSFGHHTGVLADKPAATPETPPNRK